MADRAYITPKVLKWSRETARMTLEAAASKVSGLTPEKLEEWEKGESLPTIKQAEALAKAYRRPFALFFLPDIPRDFQTLQDFRRKTAKPLGTASIFIIREIQQKQAWISEMLQDNADNALSFVGRFTIRNNPQAVANDILETLKIDPQNYNTDYPIKEWIDKAEKHGIFISRTSFIHSHLKLDSEEMQGFAIADKHAPFVFINSEDWDAPQLFTIVHELVHIWIAASGISNEIESGMQDAAELNPIELFCNEVTALALMPTEVMRSFGRTTFSTSTDIFKAAKKMGVSSYALLVRAYKMQLVSIDKYRKLKADIESDFRAFIQREDEKKARQKQKEGGPSPYLLRLNKNGRLFTQLVLDSFRGGLIEATMASNLLNTQVNNFPKLEAWLYR
jgi:Zn-dependent peptidase ImmA (M78 family)